MQRLVTTHVCIQSAGTEILCKGSSAVMCQGFGAEKKYLSGGTAILAAKLGTVDKILHTIHHKVICHTCIATQASYY